MRRVCYFFLSLLMTVLTACGEQEPAGNVRTPVKLAAAVRESQTELPVMHVLSPADEDFLFFLTEYYQLDGSQLEDGIICYADGVEASEIAVFLFSDKDGAQAAVQVLEAYRTARAGDFIGYAPQQAEMVEGGMTAVNGRYAALLICPDPEAAQAAFWGDAAPVQSPSAPEGPGVPVQSLLPKAESSAPAVTADTYAPGGGAGGVAHRGGGQPVRDKQGHPGRGQGSHRSGDHRGHERLRKGACYPRLDDGLEQF